MLMLSMEEYIPFEQPELPDSFILPARDKFLPLVFFRSFTPHADESEGNVFISTLPGGSLNQFEALPAGLLLCSLRAREEYRNDGYQSY